MKREEVKAIFPDITDEQLTKIMDLHGADIERQKQTITTLTTERDAARTQLGEANKKLEGYDPEWKSKAEKAENDAKAQVAELHSEFAAQTAVSAVKFSSESAKKASGAPIQTPFQGHAGTKKGSGIPPESTCSTTSRQAVCGQERRCAAPGYLA